MMRVLGTLTDDELADGELCRERRAAGVHEQHVAVLLHERCVRATEHELRHRPRVRTSLPSSCRRRVRQSNITPIVAPSASMTIGPSLRRPRDGPGIRAAVVAGRPHGATFSKSLSTARVVRSPQCTTMSTPARRRRRQAITHRRPVTEIVMGVGHEADAHRRIIAPIWPVRRTSGRTNMCSILSPDGVREPASSVDRVEQRLRPGP